MKILQIRYDLLEGREAVDVRVLNRAEFKLLKILEEISEILMTPLRIETEILHNGRMKLLYKFSEMEEEVSCDTFLSLFVEIAIDMMTGGVMDISLKGSQSSEIDPNLKLSTWKKRLIEEKNSLANDKEFKILKQKLLVHIACRKNIRQLISDFYAMLQNVVRRISFQEIDTCSASTLPEKIIDQSDFEKFILKSADMKNEIQKQVILEIVSPVLKQTQGFWRALYRGEDISFVLKDEEFKNLVIDKKLNFYNGIKILCDLETRRVEDSDDVLERNVYNITRLIYCNGNMVVF